MGGYETPKDKKEQTGRVFKMIVKDLEGCGYKVSTKLFKVKYYNMPQNRERIIFFGIREDLDVSFEWAVAEDTITKTLRDAIGDLPVEQDSTIQHHSFKNKIEISFADIVFWNGTRSAILSPVMAEIFTRVRREILLSVNVPVFRVFPISFGSREQFPGSTSRLEMLFLFNWANCSVR